MNNKSKRINIEEEHFTEANCPYKIKPKFSTLGSFIEISSQRPINVFLPDDSIRSLLGFNATTIYEEYNLSPNPVDIILFDIILLETDVAQGTIFRGKRSGIYHIFTTDVDPGYRYIEKFRGGVQWYMMNSKDFISSINFELKNEIGKLISFNGQSITTRLAIKEV